MRQLMDENRAQATAFIEQVTGMPVQQLVFNSSVTAATPTEIAAVISLGQRPLAMLIMSPTMAKTLALSLLARVTEYEEMSDSKVKALNEFPIDQGRGA